MKKKLVTLLLLSAMLLSSFTACGQETDSATEANEKAQEMTATITLTAIVGDSTTPEAIAEVQEAINKLTKSEHKTQVILQMKTASEYEAFIESQVEELEAIIAAEKEADEKRKAEAKARRDAEKAANMNKKNRSKWVTTSKEETSDTAIETQEMTKDEYGRTVVKYPDLEGPSLDIIFITGEAMLNDYIAKEWLAPLTTEMTNDSKILNKYIYPTILSAGKDGNNTYAIPNNRLIGEYTYLLIDKTLAEKYELNIEEVDTLTDCKEFLDAVIANEPDYMPLNKEVDLNYLQHCGEEGSMLGAIIKPNYEHRVPAIPRNLLDMKSYIEHEALLDKLSEGGYIGEAEKYAIEVRTGYINTPEKENWEENYAVVLYEKPIADERIYEGMFAVSSYASNLPRCMEIITMLNTNEELRNIYAFGVEGVHYELNEDGTVHMLNNDWSMNFFHSGNTLIGATPETLPVDYKEIAILQNIETLVNPYFKWNFVPSEENPTLVDEFKALSDRYMEEFENAEDKIEFAKSLKSEFSKNSVLSKMLNVEDLDGFAGQYYAFHNKLYPSD